MAVILISICFICYYQLDYRMIAALVSHTCNFKLKNWNWKILNDSSESLPSQPKLMHQTSTKGNQVTFTHFKSILICLEICV